jgi:phosphatidylglycerophosphatase A
MVKVHQIVASTFGIGYVGKGGGTLAAIFAAVCWYYAHLFFHISAVTDVIITSFIILIGVWSSFVVEPLWGKDDKKVVIDEVAGLCVSLLFIPPTFSCILIALILFRFFDITKPFFIKKSESLNGGWGVMADDVLSGMYANVLMQLIILGKFF